MRARHPLGNTHRRRDGTQPFVVPTPMLAAVLTPLVDKLNAQLDTDNNPAHAAGAISVIAGRVSRLIDGIAQESVPRRTWSIFAGETERTSTEMADAMLLALDVQIEDTDLPTLPGTIAGSIEMVDTWASELNELEARRLAVTMIHFSNGFISGLANDPEFLIEREAARAVARFIKALAPTRDLELVA